MNIGERMKYVRTAELISQGDIASKLNISRSTYKEYERQYSLIPIKHLNEFCNIFDFSIDYILGLSDLEKYSCTQKDIDLKKMAQRLKDFRKENKLTQSLLSQNLNCADTTLAGYETARHVISTSNLYDLCKKYNISADYLLGKIDSPKYLNK